MSIFQQLITSIYSPQTVAKFRFQGIGKTILYVFVLMIITTSVAAYQLSSSISTTITDFQEELEHELPDFELKNSVLVSDIKEPYYKTKNGDTFIFDPTGTISALDVEKKHTNALALLKTEAILMADGVAETIRYSDLGTVSMTKEQVVEFTNVIVELLPLIITIVIFVLFLVLTTLKYIGIFVLTLFGLIIKRNTGVNLSYKQNWILCAYAVTLPTVFFAITDTLSIYIPFSLTLYWIVAVIMLYLIIKEIPQKEKQEEVENLDQY